MMRLFVIAITLLLLPVAVGADPTSFQSGAEDPSEAFGAAEGIVFFAAAIAALALIYGLMLWGRQVHRRTKQELQETAKLLGEKS